MGRPDHTPDRHRRLRRSESLSFLLLGAVSVGLWGLFSLISI